MKDDNLLIEGNVFRVLLKFSVPFLMANIIQALYGTMDLMVIGWYHAPGSVAAVSAGTQVTQIVTSMVSGLILGSTIMVGKYTGMGDEDRARKTIGTILSVLAIIAILLTIVMLTFKGSILAALKTPAASLRETNDYVTICFYGIFFIYGYNAIGAILRGYDDPRRPMHFAALFCVPNIIGNIMFVKYLGLGVAGIALATVLSQSISMICSIICPNRSRFIFTFNLKSLCIGRLLAKELAMVGIPISPQKCMVRFSFLYLTSVTNRLGVSTAVTVGIISKYDVFAMLPAISIASALAAATVHNYGAGEPERARQSLATGIGFSVLASLLLSLWAQLSPQIMIGLFSTNPDIISAGIPFFHSCGFDYLAVSSVFCPDRFMDGRSKAVFTMISRYFGALALRIPLIWLAYTYYPGNLFVIGSIAPAVPGFMTVYAMGFVLRQIRADRTAIVGLRLGDDTVQRQSFPEKDSKKDSKSHPTDSPHQQDGFLS